MREDRPEVLHPGDGSYEIVDEVHHFSDEHMRAAFDSYEEDLDRKLALTFTTAGPRGKLSMLYLRFAQWCKRRARGRA